LNQTIFWLLGKRSKQEHHVSHILNSYFRKSDGCLPQARPPRHFRNRLINCLARRNDDLGNYIDTCPGQSDDLNHSCRILFAPVYIAQKENNGDWKLIGYKNTFCATVMV
jgi:hypothetical protein